MTRTMRLGTAALLLSAGLGWAAAGIAAEATSPRAAADLEEKGHWTEAAAAWAELSQADPRDRDLWKRRLIAIEVSGHTEELERAATEAMGLFPGWDEPVIRRARSLTARGRSAEGIELLRLVQENSMPAAAELGLELQIQGKLDEAGAVFSSIVKRYGAAQDYTPEELLAAGIAARERGDYQGAVRVFEMSYTDSLDFVPGRLALARLFYDKHEAELAGNELNDARKVAPNHPDVVLALAELAAMNKQLAQAEAVAERVDALRPGDPGARRVLARLDLIAGETDSARDRLKPVLAANPEDREAATVVAAAAYLDGDDAAFEKEAARIRTRDPRNVDAFLLLGDILELLIRNKDAVAVYQRVLEVDPDNPPALAALGHLAMREGREEEARGYLEKAFDLDKYNVRAYNQLELLDKMDTFTSYDFPRFQFRLEADKDSALVPLLADRLDHIYDDLTRRHGWTPPNKTIVEIFPTHEWFSARVTGLAWIEGIPGVCFGDVIAMDSPRTLSGTSNWEQILRHEFGHVLALGMTDRQVPFWFTEGLSVYLETHPRGQNWDEVLVGAWWDGEVVGVDSLTIAFTRPRSRFQRLLAYHEAGLIIADIVDRHGWDSVPALLRAFGKGKKLPEAVPEVLGESYDEFRTHSLEAVLARATSAKVWPQVDPDRRDQLLAATKRDPDNLVLQERLLVTLAQLSQWDDAEALANRILERHPENPRAIGILGLGAKFQDDPDAAKRQLAKAIELGSEDITVYQMAARLALDDGDTTAALQRFQESLSVYPNSPEPLSALAWAEAAKGDTVAARAYYRRVLEVDDSAAEPAVGLARIELATRNGDAAKDALDFALGVVPLDAEVIALRGQALLLLDHDEEAREEFLRARTLDIRSVESMVGMAEYYLKQQDFEEAGYFADLALKYDPDHPEAKRILAAAHEVW